MILLITPMVIWAKLFFIVILSSCFFLVDYRKYFLLRAKTSIVEIVIFNDEIWHCVNAKGERLPVRLQNSSVINKLVLIPHFRIDDVIRKHGKFFSVVIFCDAMDKDSFRRLKVAILTY